MIRALSHSESQTVFDCEYRHAFAYTGHLTGGEVLHRKTAAPRLRDGRAWGRGLATYREHQLETDGVVFAHEAIDLALDEDATEQRKAGVYDLDVDRQARDRLHLLLDHHVSIAPPLVIERPEHELLVGIPSRTGRRRSSRYRLRAYLDGLHQDEHGWWLYEAKLRGQLTPLELLVLGRQLRWYAYAARELFDIEPVGVIVEERLNEVPKPARVNRGRGKDPQPVASHAKDQLTTPELYREACARTGVEPEPETVEALAARRWFQLERVVFRPGELDEAGRQLVSTAQLIHELDSGARVPVRNPGRARCPGCPFREICAHPSDVDLVDALYDRRPPKRARDHEEVAA